MEIETFSCSAAGTSVDIDFLAGKTWDRKFSVVILPSDPELPLLEM